MKPKLPFEIDSLLERKICASSASNGTHLPPDSKAQVPERIFDALESLSQLERDLICYMIFEPNSASRDIKQAAKKFNLSDEKAEETYSEVLRKLRRGKSKGFPPFSLN